MGIFFKILMITGLITISIIVYLIATLCIGYSLSGNDDDLAFIYAWTLGLVIFVVMIILWATVPCPFFITF